MCLLLVNMLEFEESDLCIRNPFEAVICGILFQLYKGPQFEVRIMSMGFDFEGEEKHRIG